jgi:hypothetical protein
MREKKRKTIVYYNELFIYQFFFYLTQKNFILIP